MTAMPVLRSGLKSEALLRSVTLLHRSLTLSVETAEYCSTLHEQRTSYFSDATVSRTRRVSGEITDVI